MTATMTSSAPAPLEKTKVDAFEVGWLFVQEYYTILNRDPQRLHCFYNKKSSFLHGHEGEATVKTFHGQQEIHRKILDMDFQDAKVLVSNVDSQASLNGGIVVQVLGEMSNNSGTSHKFAQTFFLAEQVNGYYVLNDIFRFLKEDIDNDYEDAEDPTGGLELHDAYIPEETHVAPQYHEPAHVEPEVVKSPSPKKVAEKPRTPSPYKEHRTRTPDVRPESVNKNTAPEVTHTDAFGLGNWSEPAATAEEPAPQEAAKPAPWGTIAKPKAPAASEEETKNVAQPASEKPTEAQKPAAQPQQQQQHQQQQQQPEQKPETTQNKTWASLAAKNANVWSADAKPAAAPQPAAPKPAVAVPVSQRTASPKPVALKAQADDAHAQAAAHDGSNDADQKDGGFREVHGRQQKRGPPPGQQYPQHPSQTDSDDDKEKYSIYIRGITEAIDRKSLTDTFSKIGTVRHVDVVLTKNIAFVEFTTVEAARKAIGNSYTVNNVVLHAEERRKPRPFINSNNRGPYPPRNFLDGGNRGGRGDFQRGGMQGNRGGRGGYNNNSTMGPPKPAPGSGAPNGNKPANGSK
ncbi:uncharacterized protein EV422DRAFT_529866 [Fimicolochytrium jonesii]|uniref:uncharacterized protein n=1 Tax=Fimicolochytrium jonesii TaxID=1396493 RepID=UPI0022FE3E8E|nr:uncharacterized protein EV422DRAFT_529866 [Fimicolochytrium jonesii]KAI8820712.1 hypothetical protein EV422DRAFT_529866 [Fimicolochytrium jonesii]